MRIFRHHEALPAEMLGAAVAIGNFDGMHRGHQAVIGEAGMLARATGAPWAVLTFEPHPRNVFRPGDPPFRLTPEPVKARLIAAMGVDALVIVTFDREFSLLTAEDFVTEILVGGLHARHVVAGYDFAFGKGRRGDCTLLLRMGREAGFDFTVVQAVRGGDGLVHSSSAVRDALRQGRPRDAAAILGRPFEIEAEVMRGDARGRTIGFPTANLALGDYLRPAQGVYAVRAVVPEAPSPVWLHGVANLGSRPTVGGGDVNLEVHLLDFAGEIYGKRLRVELIEYLRPEKKFDDLGGLRAQIARDCDDARAILAGM